eukprot:2582631-Rhodomonas_salina.2
MSYNQVSPLHGRGLAVPFWLMLTQDPSKLRLSDLPVLRNQMQDFTISAQFVPKPLFFCDAFGFARPAAGTLGSPSYVLNRLGYTEGATSLRPRYAVSGTNLAYGARAEYGALPGALRGLQRAAGGGRRGCSGESSAGLPTPRNQMKQPQSPHNLYQECGCVYSIMQRQLRYQPTRRPVLTQCYAAPRRTRMPGGLVGA